MQGAKRKRARTGEAELAPDAPDPSTALLETLVNQTVIAVEHDGGTYSLHFADGRTAVFSSSGDDATWTSFAVEGGE